MKFKVGDHVVGNESARIYLTTKRGWQGEVVEVRSERLIVVRALPGHPGGAGNFPVAAHCFDLIPCKEDRKIVVTVDGETTTARLYNGKVLEKSAEAKCSPGDRFDFKVGAGLAIDRLLGREAPKPDLFPLGDIKAGYLIRVRHKDETYNMTVIPGGHDGKLGCCSRHDWWSLDRFGESLDYEGRQIIEVYGYTCNMCLLENDTRDRKLLWSRAHGKV